MQPQAVDSGDKKKAVVQSLISVGLLVVIFGFVLPELVDFSLVWQAIKDLEWTEVLALLAGGAFLWFTLGWEFAAARPGLGIPRGTLAWLSSTCWANIIPIPFDIAVRFGMYRYWGFSAEQFGISTVMSGIWTVFIKLGLPVVAIGVQLIDGRDIPEWLLIIGAIGAAALIAGIVIFVGVIRSQSFARRVGATASRAVNWVLRTVKKPELDDIEGRVLELRENASGTIKQGAVMLTIANAFEIAANVALLTMALRFMGVNAETLSWIDVFTGYAIVLLVTVIPITPGGVGVAALAYLWTFQQLANVDASGMPKELLEASMAAAVFIYRIITWLLVIPVGFAAQFIWRWRVKKKTGEDPIKVVMTRGAGSPAPSS